MANAHTHPAEWQELLDLTLSDDAEQHEPRIKELRILFSGKTEPEPKRRGPRVKAVQGYILIAPNEEQTFYANTKEAAEVIGYSLTSVTEISKKAKVIKQGKFKNYRLIRKGDDIPPNPMNKELKSRFEKLKATLTSSKKAKKFLVKVEVIDRDGNKQYFNTAKEAATHLEVASDTIRRCINTDQPLKRGKNRGCQIIPTYEHEQEDMELVSPTGEMIGRGKYYEMTKILKLAKPTVYRYAREERIIHSGTFAGLKLRYAD